MKNYIHNDKKKKKKKKNSTRIARLDFASISKHKIHL